MGHARHRPSSAICARAKVKALADSDEAFCAALANDSRSHRDKRVCAAFATARGGDQAFLPESLERIYMPEAAVASAANANGALYWRVARMPS
jgi:predicted dienelactone hydrolase